MFTFNGFLAKLKTKFSTNKTPTNNHRFPLVLPDGTPDGNATPADIMQFLGVAQYHTHFNSGDLNQLTEPGTWLVSLGPDVINGPVGVSGQAVFEIVRLGTSSPHFLQRLTMESNGKVYTRCKKSTQEGFFPWSE